MVEGFVVGCHRCLLSKKHIDVLGQLVEERQRLVDLTLFFANVLQMRSG
jgi:hypothetical protein